MPGTHCYVPGCVNRNWKQKPPGLQFHRIPRSGALREKWLMILSVYGNKNPGAPFEPIEDFRVCCSHFQGGAKTAIHNIPVIFNNVNLLGNRSHQWQTEKDSELISPVLDGKIEHLHGTLSEGTGAPGHVQTTFQQNQEFQGAGRGHGGMAQYQPPLPGMTRTPEQSLIRNVAPAYQWPKTSSLTTPHQVPNSRDWMAAGFTNSSTSNFQHIGSASLQALASSNSNSTNGPNMYLDGYKGPASSVSSNSSFSSFLASYGNQQLRQTENPMSSSQLYSYLGAPPDKRQASEYGVPQNSSKRLDIKSEPLSEPAINGNGLLQQQQQQRNQTPQVTSSSSGVQYTCTICQQAFAQQVSLYTHQDMFHQSVLYDDLFLHNLEWKGTAHYNHKKRMSQSGDGSPVLQDRNCVLCGMSLPNVDTLRAHLITIHSVMVGPSLSALVEAKTPSDLQGNKVAEACSISADCLMNQTSLVSNPLGSYTQTNTNRLGGDIVVKTEAEDKNYFI